GRPATNRRPRGPKPRAALRRTSTCARGRGSLAPNDVLRRLCLRWRRGRRRSPGPSSREQTWKPVRAPWVDLPTLGLLRRRAPAVFTPLTDPRAHFGSASARTATSSDRWRFVAVEGLLHRGHPLFHHGTDHRRGVIGKDIRRPCDPAAIAVGHDLGGAVVVAERLHLGGPNDAPQHGVDADDRFTHDHAVAEGDD